MDSEFWMPSVFGDGMVLQAEKAWLWGRATPGVSFDLAWGGRSVRAETDSQGRWKVCLEDLPVGGPSELTKDGLVLFRNVWAGDLWLCTGQSNMERSLAAAAPWPDDALVWKGDSGIRHFKIPHCPTFDPPFEEVPERPRWEGADTDAVVNFSAVAFHFARDVRARTGRPIGLLVNAVGGSTVQAWLSPSSLPSFPAYDGVFRDWSRPGRLEAVKKAEGEAERQWTLALDSLDPPDPERAGEPGAPWVPFEVPGSAQGAGLGSEPGSIWLRKEFELAPGDESGPARLSLGRMVDADRTWVNGVEVGSTGYQYPARRYNLPAGRLRAGTNQILVRLVGPTPEIALVPGHPYHLQTTPRTVDLSQGWQARRGARTVARPRGTWVPELPGALYSGMLAPLLGLGLRGVLWYQGETNAEAPEGYGAVVKTLIGEFRRAFQRPDLPFLFAQLPLWQQPCSEVEEVSGWPEIRDAQRLLLQVPHTGLAVTLDAGEPHELHPSNKAPVGLRLARVARALVYGEALDPWTGPLAREARREGAVIRVRFDQVGTGLSTSDGQAPGHLFFRGERAFRRATARIAGPDLLIDVDGFAVDEVRYAWAIHPQGANLVNSEGLPASPFRLEVV